MKKFMQFIAAVKTVAALAFTAQIMFVTVVSMFFGREGVPISYIWQMIFLALIYGCLQLAVFSENYFRRMGTTGRMALLGVSMFVALSGFAVIFQWFPALNLANWLIFAGLYTAAFLIAAFALRTVFRLGGLKYTQMLTLYHTDHDKG